MLTRTFTGLEQRKIAPMRRSGDGPVSERYSGNQLYPAGIRLERQVPLVQELSSTLRLCVDFTGRTWPKVRHA